MPTVLLRGNLMSHCMTRSQDRIVKLLLDLKTSTEREFLVVVVVIVVVAVVKLNNTRYVTDQ